MKKEFLPRITRISRMGKMIHQELSRSIIGSAMEVLNELKPGLDEKLYERAMAIELRRRGHTVALQSSFPVFYRGEMIGNLVPDMIIDALVIVDSKVVSAFTDSHAAPYDRLLEHRRPKTRIAPQLLKRQSYLEARGQRTLARKQRPTRSTFPPSVKSA